MANIKRYRRGNDLVNTGFNDFYHMIDSFFNEGFMPMKAIDHTSFKVDIKDEEDRYVIEAELPGYKKDEISIEYDDGRMMISACKEENIDESDEELNYIHKESRSSSMSRSMYFENVDGDKIDASLKDGILEVCVPKMDKEEKVKKIDIK